MFSVGAIAIALSSASGAPDDPFIIALPGRDTQPPEGVRAPSTSTSSVADVDGSASFRYPIEVPPGRSGMAPDLSLSYSSNGALRGGLAVGWSLHLPTIERDPGSAITTRYLLDLDGKPQLLVPVPTDPGTGTRYRLEVDDDGTRIARSGAVWTVQTPDGRVRTFAGTSASSDGDSRWNLTSERDPFGNEIVYVWSAFSVAAGYSEYLPLRIEFSSNAAAGLAAHARLRFNWSAFEFCPNADLPKGAQGDHHFGRKRMRGSMRLASLETEARDTPGGSWRTVRRTSLTYDATQLACVGERPALRYLTQIDATAWSPSGVAASAPPMRFTYGPTQRLMTQQSWSMVGPRGLGELGLRRGPEAALMDFDGDGITDQVRVVNPPVRPVNRTNLGEHRCRLFYRRGFFGGGFDQTERELQLPTAAWFHASGNPVEIESCTLNGQYAWRQADTTGPGTTCAMRDAQIAYQLIDWDHDGDLDLVTGAWQMGPNLYLGGDFPTPPQSALFSPTQPDPDEGAANPVCSNDLVRVGNSCVAACAAGMESDGGNSCQSGCAMFDSCSGCGETSCAELPPIEPLPRGCTLGEPRPELLDPTHPDTDHVWRVYLNERDVATGARSFRIAEPIVRDHMPVPVALAGGPLAPPAAGRATLPSLVDLDGDGRLDLVKMVPASGNTHQVKVWRGLAGQHFDTVEQLWASTMGGIDDVTVHDSNVTVSNGLRVVDVNGDGLLDVVSGSDGGSVRVRYNMHGSFAAERDLGVSGPPEIDRLEMPASWSPGMALDKGWRAGTRQLVDIDDDGLPEIVSFTPPSQGVEGDDSSRFIRRLDGNPFIGTYGSLGAAWEPLERLVRVDAVGRQRVWWRVSDFVDVTGDGRNDLVTWQRTGLASVMTDAPGAPARVLTRIDNGRGGITSFTYGASTDPTLVTASGRNDARWLVRQIAVAPGQGQPEQKTTYRYSEPVYRADSDPLRGPGFVGYSSVTAERSGQGGDASSRTVRDYRHDLDRARLTRERSELRSGAAWIAVSETTQRWQVLDLFGGEVEAVLPDLAVTRSYRADGSLAATRFRRELWSPRLWPYVGGAVLFENTGTEEGVGDGSAAPMRSTRRQFQVRMGQPPYAAGDYRMLQTLDEQRRYDSGAPVRVARTTTTYSDATGLPTETAVDTGIGDPARTVRTFDSATGLVLTTQRPNQVAAASGRVTRFTLDAHKLYATRTVNELGHTTQEQRDPGTGAVVRREGPNSRTFNLPNCTFGICKSTQYEPTAWTIDGFGRPLIRSVATEPSSGGGYALTAVEWITYDDASLPNRRTTERLRDWGGNVRLRSELELDGLGRVTRAIERSGEYGVVDTVTDYLHDAGGALHLIKTPDPRLDTGYPVLTTLSRDGLGRVIEVTRPDGARERTAYDGLEERHWTESSDGVGAETRLVRDAFGRLIEVREHDNPIAGAIGVTRYEHDVLDRVTRITDADGGVTALAYDQRGLRTRIDRGARSWFYSHDLDGNPTAETSPVPAWVIPANALSIWSYDDLGRVIQHVPARRGLDATRRQQLAADAVTYTHDAGSNAIGQLSSVHHARPAAAAPHWRIDYTYGLRGELRREQRAIAVDYRGAATATQWVDRTYDATGAPVDVTWDDGTTWRQVRDGRGQLQELRWLDPSIASYRSVARYTRGLTGAPRVRTSAYDQTRHWTYDAMARVVRDRVFRPSNNVSLAERDLAYDGLGHLAAVGGQVDGGLADATYVYDRRGRVTAASVSSGYDASFSYSAGGNLTSASVHGALDTPDRDVIYRHGAVDPQAVDRLDRAAGGPALATLTYDPAGNLTTRTVPGGTWNLTWDGGDQLREASGPTGTETYYYAGGPERIVAIRPDGSVSFWFGESETELRNGVQVRRWHHLDAGEPVARIENRTSIELQYADTLDNLALTVSSGGAVTSSFIYGAFGEQVAAAGATSHRRQFNGKEHDSATGLVHHGHRSYDPLLLRWISADPKYRFAPETAWAEPQRANLYAFSLNNPLHYLDRDGLDGQCPCVGDAYWTPTLEATKDFVVEHVVFGVGAPRVAWELKEVYDDIDEGKSLEEVALENLILDPLNDYIRWDKKIEDAQQVIEAHRRRREAERKRAQEEDIDRRNRAAARARMRREAAEAERKRAEERERARREQIRNVKPTGK